MKKFIKLIFIYALCLGLFGQACSFSNNSDEDYNSNRVPFIHDTGTVAMGTDVFVNVTTALADDGMIYGPMILLEASFSDPSLAEVSSVDANNNGVWLYTHNEGIGELWVSAEDLDSHEVRETTASITIVPATDAEWTTCESALFLPGQVLSLPYTLRDAQGNTLQGHIESVVQLHTADGTTVSILNPASGLQELRIPQIFTTLNLTSTLFPSLNTNITMLNNAEISKISLENVDYHHRGSGEFGVTTGNIVLSKQEKTICLKRSAYEILDWTVIQGDHTQCLLLQTQIGTESLSHFRIENKSEYPCEGLLSIQGNTDATPISVHVN